MRMTLESAFVGNIRGCQLCSDCHRLESVEGCCRGSWERALVDLEHEKAESSYAPRLSVYSPLPGCIHDQTAICDMAKGVSVVVMRVVSSSA